jgi:hypothetical protein
MSLDDTIEQKAKKNDVILRFILIAFRVVPYAVCGCTCLSPRGNEDLCIFNANATVRENPFCVRLQKPSQSWEGKTVEDYRLADCQEVSYRCSIY